MTERVTGLRRRLRNHPCCGEKEWDLHGERMNLRLWLTAAGRCEAPWHAEKLTSNDTVRVCVRAPVCVLAPVFSTSFFLTAFRRLITEHSRWRADPGYLSVLSGLSPPSPCFIRLLGCLVPSRLNGCINQYSYLAPRTDLSVRRSMGGDKKRGKF